MSATRFISKCDDFRGKSGRFMHFNDLVQENEVLCSRGVIGWYLRNPNKEHIDYVKYLLSTKKYYFWNHGFFHACSPYEFQNKTSFSQKMIL